MNRYVDEVERAFQLARSGEYGTIEEIKKRLIAEGYWGNRITGRVLLRQLRQLLKDTARQCVVTEETGSSGIKPAVTARIALGQSEKGPHRPNSSRAHEGLRLTVPSASE